MKDAAAASAWRSKQIAKDTGPRQLTSKNAQGCRGGIVFYPATAILRKGHFRPLNLTLATAATQLVSEFDQLSTTGGADRMTLG
ncbi:MAG: hypothetical protein DRQ64_08730, partial [Gammaproteobacteria bacterium]